MCRPAFAGLGLQSDFCKLFSLSCSLNLLLLALTAAHQPSSGMSCGTGVDSLYQGALRLRTLAVTSLWHRSGTVLAMKGLQPTAAVAEKCYCGTVCALEFCPALIGKQSEELPVADQVGTAAP